MRCPDGAGEPAEFKARIAGVRTEFFLGHGSGRGCHPLRAVQGVAGGAEQRGAVVEDDAQRDLAHEFAEAALGEESPEE